MSKSTSEINERINYLKKQIPILKQLIASYKQDSQNIMLLKTVYDSQIALSREANNQKYEQLKGLKETEAKLNYNIEYLSTLETAAPKILGQILQKRGLLDNAEDES